MRVTLVVNSSSCTKQVGPATLEVDDVNQVVRLTATNGHDARQYVGCTGDVFTHDVAASFVAKRAGVYQLKGLVTPWFDADRSHLEPFVTNRSKPIELTQRIVITE